MQAIAFQDLIPDNLCYGESELMSDCRIQSDCEGGQDCIDGSCR